MSFVSPIAVGLFLKSGVKTQIKANENNISKLVMEELEKEKNLLYEKVRIEREDRWWKLKFDLFVDTTNALLLITQQIMEEKIPDAIMKIGNLISRVTVIYDDKIIRDKIDESFDLIKDKKPDEITNELLYEFGRLFGQATRLMKNELELGDRVPAETA